MGILGLTLDEFVSWKPHCSVLANKLSKNCGVLNRVKNILPIDSLKMIYHSFILSYISYGLVLWGGSPETVTKRIKLLQKKAIRSVTRSSWLAHTEPRLKNLGLLNINDQFLYQTSCLTYDIVNRNCPDIYIDKFPLASRAHTHRLRANVNNPLDLVVPPASSKTDFFSNAPRLWNDLPNEIKASENKPLFKIKLNKNV